jgi:hypothetical protein
MPSNFSVFNKVNENGRIRIEQIKEVAPELDDLIDPMQITLAVLQEVNVAFLNLISDENEVGSNTHLLDDLYTQLIETFKLSDDKTKFDKVAAVSYPSLARSFPAPAGLAPC